MKKKIVLAVLLFLMSVLPFYLSGCSSFYSSGIFSVSRSRREYFSVLEKWTKKADIYNKLNTVMYIRATYLSRPFVRAYAKEYAKYYLLNSKAYKEKFNGLAPAFNSRITLLVSVYTPKKSYNNMDSKRSIWTIYLVNSEGESIMPQSVKPSQKKRVFLRKFFPYVTDWSKQYIIKFPRYYDKKSRKLFINSGTKYIKLIITGVNGKAVLRWNL